MIYLALSELLHIAERALTNDAAYDFVIEIATGQLDSVDDIAARLRTATATTARPARLARC